MKKWWLRNDVCAQAPSEACTAAACSVCPRGEPCARVSIRAHISPHLTSTCPRARGSLGCAGASPSPARDHCRLPVAGVPPHPECDHTQPLAGPGAVEGRRHEVRAPAGETLKPLRATAGRTASRVRPVCGRTSLCARCLGDKAPGGRGSPSARRDDLYSAVSGLAE